MPTRSASLDFDSTLFEKLLSRGSGFGSKKIVLECADRQTLDLRRLKLGSPVLSTERFDADRSAGPTHARANGCPELWVQKAVVIVDGVPVLGPGKVDFKAAQALVFRQRGPTSQSLRLRCNSGIKRDAMNVAKTT